ncbi:hypothetical protein [Faecalibacterium prausnitzii]|uniref:SLH domain-containing protein n=1 Tax=Faecalibacterium prausnitzii TaxID=853 RepID=A0A2A7A7P7_9FIRM|nr:hypothetical protein [Faecalibacterium prausnitzii]PDX75156.1 hypothetical protein CGS56_10085 [Faecalibacterium prausnitzii]
MKVKRIVSILLTGSMLLSLLPVSALAAAPVFDAPAQTTAKKAAPLVQEADASRSTEEEAATRSSRDLDAENSTSDSFTIDLNAGGMPESEGDYDHWFYSANSTTLFLYDGTFTLQPSSESGAESALQTDLDIRKDAEFNSGTVGKRAHNEGTISGGTFQKAVHNDATPNNQGFILDGIFKEQVHNWGTISGGIFQGEVHNWGTISGGTFEEVVEMNESPEGAKIEGGAFKKGIELNAYFPTITIKDGLFDGEVSAAEGYSGTLSISGGYFVNKPTVLEGSDTGFTTVSYQAGRTFQVPVNGGWSENNYNELYVPSGSSEQPNTITVKTAAPLTDCLADGVSIMGTDKVRKNDDGSYTIDVYSPTSIVLVTEEPSAPPTDDPGELDPAFSSGAAALGVVLGTAGLGYVAYINGTSLYLHYALPGGFIPSTRQELANVLWTTAGKPDPVSTVLYTDIPADAIEQQKAARWCVEQGLLSDYGATFGPDTTVTNARIIRAWNSLKKVPVTITN